MAELNFNLLTPQTGPTDYEQAQARSMQNRLTQQQLAQSQQATQLGAARVDEIKRQATHEKISTAIKDIAGFNTREEVLQDMQRKLQSGELDHPNYQKVLSTLPPDNTNMNAWKTRTLRNLLSAKEQLDAMENDQASARLNETFNMGAPQAESPAPAPIAAPAEQVNPRHIDLSGPGLPGFDNETTDQVAARWNAAKTNNLAPAPAAPVNALAEQTLPPVAVTAPRSPTLPSLEQGMMMAGSRNKGEAEVGKRIVDYYEKQPELLKLQAQQNRLLQMGATPKDPEMRAIQDAIKKVSTHAPAASTTVNLGQEKAFNQAVGKGQGEKLMASKQAAEDARDILDTVTAGRNIMKSGMITGSGADFLVNLNQGLKTIGVDAGYSDAAANSQAYVATMAQNVGKLIKQFGAGTGLSDADRAYAEKMAGGNITLDKKAIEKILEINERAANNVIKRHNKSVQGVETNIPLTVELPTAATAAPAAPTNAPPKGVDPAVWQYMSPEDRKLWQK